MSLRPAVFFTFVLLTLSTAVTSRAATIEFVVNPALSSLAMTPTVTIFGSPLPTSAQAPGSLTTTYSGSLFADVTATTIQLQAGSKIIAGNSGNWQPGTDYSNYPGDLDSPTGYVNTALPANYGILTDLTALAPVIGKNGQSPSAVRDLQITLTNSAPKGLAGGAFNEAGTLTDFADGTVYYGSGGIPPITDLTIPEIAPGALLNVAAATGTLTESGGVLTLTIPVSFNVSYPVNFLVLTTHYEGTIVATHLVPEPSTMLLASLAGAGLVVVSLRKTRQRTAL